MQVASNFNIKAVWLGKVHPSFVLSDHKAHAFFAFVQRRKGFVYAMQHPDRVGLLKIGRTTKNPFLRAKSLGTAGILGNFELLWVAEFVNSPWGEAEIHRELKDLHVDKEFFKVGLDRVKTVFASQTAKEELLLQDLNRDSLLKDSFEDWLDSLEVTSLVD